MKQVPAEPPLPPATIQQNSQTQSQMSSVPDNRFSLASATTVSTARSSVFSTVHGDYSRRSSASTLHSIPSEDEVVLEQAFQQKAQYEKSLQEKEFRLVQAHFISQVLVYMGYTDHAIVGSVAMALHGVDTTPRSLHKVSDNPYGVELVNVARNIDVMLELSGPQLNGLGDITAMTVGKLTYSLKKALIDKLPAWFFLEEDAPSGRLFFQDTINMLDSIISAAADSEGGENYFMQAIKAAAENPPPPPPPKGDLDANEAYVPPKISRSSAEEYSTNPVEISFHIATHPQSPYRWLRSISLTNSIKGNATSTIITHKHYHQATANVLTLQTPSVTLPTLLILTLCNSNLHLRSLQMDDRKKGHEELREAVALSRHMQSRSVRAPSSMDIPEEAIRMLERFRGPKGVEEKDLLTWVLRGNKGRRGPRMQLSVEIPKSIGYVPGRNKELRDLTLVKRASAPVVSGLGPASRQSYLSPISVHNSSRPVSISIQSPPLPPVDAFTMAANSSNRGMSSKATSSRGSSIIDGMEGSGKVPMEYIYQRLDTPGVYRRDTDVQSVSEMSMLDERGQQNEKRKSWFGGLASGLGKGRWSIGPGSSS